MLAGVRAPMALVLAAFVAACAHEPSAPPAPEAEAAPQPPPPPAHLEPPNTAPAAMAAAAQPQAVESTASNRMALHPPSQDWLEGPQIEKTFDYHKRYFHRLYAERLSTHPGLAGVMRVNFTINADGSTSGTTLVDSSLHDPEFEQAVLKQVAQMTFPAARRATPVIEYPIAFSVPPPQPPAPSRVAPAQRSASTRSAASPPSKVTQ